MHMMLGMSLWHDLNISGQVTRTPFGWEQWSKGMSLGFVHSHEQPPPMHE